MNLGRLNYAVDQLKSQISPAYQQPKFNNENSCLLNQFPITPELLIRDFSNINGGYIYSIYIYLIYFISLVYLHSSTEWIMNNLRTTKTSVIYIYKS